MASVQIEGVPDRWLGCPPYGEVIDDTFLPLKTLLRDDILLPMEYRFTPRIFAQQMKERKIDIGMLINLTFSSRYYDEDEIKDHNIQFKQISCRGHNEAPQVKEREEFIKTCNSFLARNPKKIIAVHCTHGFNRTGFMICCFLFNVRDWDLRAAVQEFASKRSPGIYKQDYLNELHNLFGDHDDPIDEAPPRPAWDADMSLLGGADLDPSALSTGVVQTVFYEGVTNVELVRDDTLRRRIYNHCCMLLNYQTTNSRISFPGAQPVSMDVTNIQLLQAHRYMVSWKADGCRYMLYIQDENNMFFLTRSLQLWQINGLKFPRIQDLNAHLTDTLLDGELVTDDFQGQLIPRYLIYDVISLDGNLVSHQSFDKRCAKIKSVIIEARGRAKQAGIISRENEPLKVADKAFWFVHEARRTWEMKVTHEKDGLIFQPVDDPYTGGTCHKILKWKPPHLNSIDFRINICEERQNGCLPETFAHFYVSNSQAPMMKLPLETKEQQKYREYNNKIVEMALVNQKWVIIRERTDKLTPNSHETARATYKSIKNPVTEADLFNFIAKIPKNRNQPSRSN